MLSFATAEGFFAATVQCHVCGFGNPTEHDFKDEQIAREAAPMACPFFHTNHKYFNRVERISPGT